MQVTCQSCQTASDRAGLDAVQGGFGFVCGDCGHTNLLAPMAVPDPGPEPAPLEAPEPGAALEPEASDPEAVSIPGRTACPKCGNVQRDHYACHRCGLVFANVKAGNSTFTADPLDGRADAKSLREHWAGLRKDLDHVDAHRQFIERCGLSNALDFAGECYRRLTPSGQPEDPRVAEYRKQIIAAAVANVDRRGQRAQDAATNLRRLLVMLVGAALLLGFAIGYFLLSRTGGHLQNHG